MDAAIVTWPQGRKKPKTYQAVSTVGIGALGGAFWGMLFGLIFLAPLFGMVVGAHGWCNFRQVYRLWHQRQLHQRSSRKK